MTLLSTAIIARSIMTTKYKNKYRIPSARAPWWDYGANAAYFVTICTGDRVHYFGNVDQGVMMLSAIGQMAQDDWQKIPAHFPYVKLGEFVVMPNHIHGILIIDKRDRSQGNSDGNVIDPPGSGSGSGPDSDPDSHSGRRD